MTHKIFCISDYHFGHANILTFKDSNGNKDSKYFNVSVDYPPIDYTPVDMEQLIKCIEHLELI